MAVLGPRILVLKFSRSRRTPVSLRDRPIQASRLDRIEENEGRGDDGRDAKRGKVGNRRLSQDGVVCTLQRGIAHSLARLAAFHITKR